MTELLLYGDSEANFAPSDARRSIMTHDGPHEKHGIRLYDARAAADISLAKTGFELAAFDSGVEDFADEAVVTSAYYKEVRRLVKAKTGASYAFVIGHLQRDGQHWGDGPKGGGVYAQAVHADMNQFFETSSRSTMDPRLRAALTGKHWAIFNVWRSKDFEADVEMWPLAVCDSSSVSAEDIAHCEIPPDSRPGGPDLRFFTLRLAQNDRQRFYVFPRMSAREYLIFKQYDTREPEQHLRQCFHSAVEDPHTSAHARPRRSIEVRVVAVFGEDSDHESRHERFRAELPSVLREAKL